MTAPSELDRVERQLERAVEVARAMRDAAPVRFVNEYRLDPVRDVFVDPIARPFVYGGQVVHGGIGA